MTENKTNGFLGPGYLNCHVSWTSKEAQEIFVGTEMFYFFTVVVILWDVHPAKLMELYFFKWMKFNLHKLHLSKVDKTTPSKQTKSMFQMFHLFLLKISSAVQIAHSAFRINENIITGHHYGMSSYIINWVRYFSYVIPFNSSNPIKQS